MLIFLAFHRKMQYNSGREYTPYQGGTTMENVVIGNATYLVSRVFVGNQNVSDIIQKRVEENHSQLLPLTNSASASYNSSGRDAG